MNTAVPPTVCLSNSLKFKRVFINYKVISNITFIDAET